MFYTLSGYVGFILLRWIIGSGAKKIPLRYKLRTTKMRTSIPIGWYEGVCLKRASDWPHSNNAIPGSPRNNALCGEREILSPPLSSSRDVENLRDADSTNQRAGLPLKANNMIFYFVLCWSLLAPDPIKK